MNKMAKALSFSSIAFMLIVAIPGCSKLTDFFKKKETGVGEVKTESKDTGVTLCSIDSKPAISEGDFNKRLREAIDMNPFSRGAPINIIPIEERRKFLDNLVNDELLLLDAKKKSIEREAEFKKAYLEIKNLVKRNMMVQFTKKKIFESIKVDAAEVQKFYAENKEHFIKIEGGTLVSGIKFTADAQANAFIAKVRPHLDEFESIAKETKSGQFTEFGRVSKESKRFALPIVPGPVKDSALAMATLPGVEKVKAGKDIWVIKASDKKETVYKELDEVRQQIENLVKSKKVEEEIQRYIKILKGEHSVSVNEDFFKAKAAPQDKHDEKVEDRDADKHAEIAKAEQPVPAATA
jgi:peptidyl-prolyl cis-trans isomerase C